MMINCNAVDLFVKPLKMNNYDRFLNLEPERKVLFNDWFEYVWKMRELPIQTHIRGFLMASDLLERIADIISSGETDDERFSALLTNPHLEGRFNHIMTEPKSLMRMYSKRFAQMWPIFDTVELGESKGILISQADVQTREDTITKYLDGEAKNYMPLCWSEHLELKDIPLPDWKHTLSAWYAVRRNILVQDWNNSESDVRIFTNAFQSLLYFYKEGKIFFENPSLKPDIFDRTQVLSSL